MKKALIPVIVAVCLTPFPLLADSHGTERPKSSASPAKKLETDERLRTGMSRIATALQSHWESVKNSSLKGDDYVGLAKGIRTELADVVAQCKLRPESDRTFHEILQDMNRGLDLMNSPRPELQRAGALALGQAVKNYGQHFDHPGWSWKL